MEDLQSRLYRSIQVITDFTISSSVDYCEDKLANYLNNKRLEQ